MGGDEAGLPWGVRRGWCEARRGLGGHGVVVLVGEYSWTGHGESIVLSEGC